MTSPFGALAGCWQQRSRTCVPGPSPFIWFGIGGSREARQDGHMVGLSP
jgi:hypothetical protein